METLNAYRDHGDTKDSLEHDIQLSGWVLEGLPELGIDIDAITRQLEDEGVEKFCEPFDKLMKTLAQRSPPRSTNEITSSTIVTLTRDELMLRSDRGENSLFQRIHGL